MTIESCKVDESVEELPILIIKDQEASILERPYNGEFVLSLTFETNQENLTFQVIDQSVPSAFEIDSAGNIKVNKPSVFKFAENPIITAQIGVQNDIISDTAFISVSLTMREPIIFNGPRVVFRKAQNADYEQAENQDRITDRVWITRGFLEGIFNPKIEIDFTRSVSPADTEWAEGTTDKIPELSFQNWNAAINRFPKGAIGKNYVLHLISENIYIDIKLLTWSDGRDDGGGGGFSYERSTRLE